MHACMLVILGGMHRVGIHRDRSGELYFCAHAHVDSETGTRRCKCEVKTSTHGLQGPYPRAHLLAEDAVRGRDRRVLVMIRPCACEGLWLATFVLRRRGFGVHGRSEPRLWLYLANETLLIWSMGYLGSASPGGKAVRRPKHVGSPPRWFMVCVKPSSSPLIFGNEPRPLGLGDMDVMER